jgi:hypothetical protein
MACPAEFHGHILETGEALVEFLTVHFRRALQGSFADLHVRKEAGAGASDDAVPTLRRIDLSHGCAHGV